MPTETALARLHICARSSEPLLLKNEQLEPKSHELTHTPLSTIFQPYHDGQVSYHTLPRQASGKLFTSTLAGVWKK